MTTYDGREKGDWFAELAPMDSHNIRHLLVLFGWAGIPETFLDVGCGTGILVETARKLGVRAYGIDQLVNEIKWGEGFYHHNLVDKWLAPELMDIVMCIEVAEHLHEDGHAMLCDTLCNSLKEGSDHYLIFTSARPGQGGYGHISCRPAEYWHNEFSLRRLSFNRSATMNLALLFSQIQSPLSHYWDNLMVFNK